MSYTQCKIVGNGSFGVVFQTKLSPNNEDAAIKRVLQDKRFKVCHTFLLGWWAQSADFSANIESRASDHAHSTPSQHRRVEGVLLLERRARE